MACIIEKLCSFFELHKTDGSCNLIKNGCGADKSDSTRDTYSSQAKEVPNEFVSKCTHKPEFSADPVKV